MTPTCSPTSRPRTTISKHWAKQHRALIDELFEEMKGRIKEDDQLGPDPRRRFSLLVGVQAGRAVSDLVPQAASAAATTQMIFDEPVEAEGKEYFRLGALEASPDGKLLATLVDDDGSERFQLRIRDLATGKDIETVTEVGIGQPVWTSDSAGIVFTEVNDNWRSYRARYHRLGRRRPRTRHAVRGDRGARLLRRRRQVARPSLIFVSTGDNATSEVRFVSADDPAQPLTLISRAQAEPRISCRRGARETVDPHQRRAREFPPGRGRSGRARRNGGR